jgi:ankyrin repeat protein
MTKQVPRPDSIENAGAFGRLPPELVNEVGNYVPTPDLGAFRATSQYVDQSTHRAALAQGMNWVTASNDRFARAAANGAWHLAEQAITVANVNCPHRVDSGDKETKTALHWAVIRGETDRIRWLLEHKFPANVNHATPYPPGYSRKVHWETALHFAAARCDRAAAEELLRHGASPNLRNTRLGDGAPSCCSGETALDVAAAPSSGPDQAILSMIATLRQYGAELGETDSPIIGAARAGRMGLVQAYLAGVGGFHFTGNALWHASRAALYGEHWEVFRLVFGRALTAPGVLTGQLGYAFHSAMDYGLRPDFDIRPLVDLILTSRPDLFNRCRAFSGWGLTAVHCAVFKEHQDLLPRLLACAELNPNAVTLGPPPDPRGIIINREALPPVPPEAKGATPLLLAIRLRKASMARLLLTSSRVEVNAANQQGTTPLHEAARLGFLEGVQLLLDHRGIQVNGLDGQGVTPITRAQRGGHGTIVDLLRQRGGVAGTLVNRVWRPGLFTRPGSE